MFSWFRQNNSSIPNENQRLLGPSENALVQASLKYQGYTRVGEVLFLNGPHISLNKLSAAVSLLQHRHRVLRSRLKINSEKPDTYLLEEDHTLQLPIIEMPRKRADHLIFWRQQWKEREKKVMDIDQGIAEFWLLQDPEDDNNENSPREIIIVCEHCFCDGISLSTVAHELLIALSDENEKLFASSLDWPITMEAAIQRSLSMVSKFLAFGRFIFTAIYARATTTSKTAQVPTANVDFPLTDMCDRCYTENCYGTLSKEETQKLLEKCRQKGITVTSAVISAITCAISMHVKTEDNDRSTLRMSIAADTRRRCIPPVPNHDLSYQVSGIFPFMIPTNNIPTTSESMWELAKTCGDFIRTSIDAGQVFALGMIMGRIFQKTLGPPNLAELPSCGISSWGVLPFSEEYGKWKLATMIPFVNMIQTTLPFSILQTVNGVLTIVYVGAAPLVTLDVLESLRDDTMKKLNQMIEN